MPYSNGHISKERSPRSQITFKVGFPEHLLCSDTQADPTMHL